MSSIYRTVTSAALAGVVAGAFFVSSPAQSTELLINNYLPPKHPFQTGITVPWMKDVVAATKGSVTPKLSAAAVGPPPKNWQTVSKGVADVVILANIFQTKRIVGPRFRSCRLIRRAPSKHRSRFGKRTRNISPRPTNIKATTWSEASSWRRM